MKIEDLINEMAKLEYLKKEKNEDVSDEYKKLASEYRSHPATEYDVSKAVVYMVSKFADLLQPVKVANTARYDLIVRSLEKNRVLSKDVLDSIKEQLDTINKEEKGIF